MRPTILWLPLLLPLGCVGDPASGGATLSGGSGDGGGTHGGSGVMDTTAGGPCQDGDAALESTWSAALDATAATATILEQRASTALSELSMIYGTSSDAATLSAEISADFNANVSGAVTMDVSPLICGGTLSATLAAADACNPGGAHTFSSCSGAARCAEGCSGTALGVLEFCPGQCWGDCSLEVAGSCEGWCEGQCDGECTAGITSDEGEYACVGECSGMCTGTCWLSLASSCSGSCMGPCQSVGTDVDASAWCLPEPAPVICAGTTLDCGADAMIDGLSPGCDTVAGLAGAAAAQCLSPTLAYSLALDAALDHDARGVFLDRLWRGRLAVAELVAVVHHLDLLLDQEVPAICAGSPGADLAQVHHQQRQALQQLRDSLDFFAI